MRPTRKKNTKITTAKFREMMQDISEDFYDDEHVRVFEYTSEMKEESEKLLNSQSNTDVPEFWKVKLRKEQVKNWDLFYRRNQTNFFKDRQWLSREFPELRRYFDDSITNPEPLLDSWRPRIIELGCGVGNTIIPILRRANLDCVGFDCSHRAVQFLAERFETSIEPDSTTAPSSSPELAAQEDHDANESRCIGQLTSCGVWDIALDDRPSILYGCKGCVGVPDFGEPLKLPDGIKESTCFIRIEDANQTEYWQDVRGSADIVLLVFVLSAIPPEHHGKVIDNCIKMLRPGGVIFLRDYATYDQKELRFAQRGKSKLQDHFYVRQDGTLAYYFTAEESKELFGTRGLEEVQNGYFLRLFKNRKTNVELRRVWIQAKWRKPADK